MKSQFIIITLVFCISIGNTGNLFAQGREVARELKEYIECDESFGADDIETVKIIPKVDTTGKIVKKTPKTIGGQAVDEVNSVIYKAFRMHPEWENMVVVADWTGSMYTYVGQIMRWHKINMEKKLLKHLVLFNDGDDVKRDGKTKKVGKTGGIYYADPNDMDDFLKKVEVAVDNGDGGDAEENDVEAIIAAFDKYKKANEVILIADNSAVRDIELVKKINKPVHVLLCNGGWVMDYIKLAYETGGTITTFQDDIDFSDKSQIDPQNIVLNGIKYKIK